MKINKIDFEHDFGEDLIKATHVDVDNVVALLKSNELSLVNLKSGMVKKIENVKWFEVVWGCVVVVDGNDVMRVHDVEEFEIGKHERELGVEGISSVFRNGKNSIFVFYDEFFNLNVYDFENEIAKENLEKFDYSKVTKFEEISTPSEAAIDNEMAHYWTTRVKDTNFCFIGWSFSESAEILYKTEEDQWALAKPEEQAIQILCPSDSNTDISSFRGIIQYPFRLAPDEKDTWMYKFTDASISIGYPKRIITLSYTGRIDVYEIYFKDIEKNQNLEPNLSVSDNLIKEEPMKIASKYLEESKNPNVEETEANQKLQSDSINDDMMIASMKLEDDKTDTNKNESVKQNEVDTDENKPKIKTSVFNWTSNKTEDKSKSGLFGNKDQNENDKSKPVLFGHKETKIPTMFEKEKSDIFSQNKEKPSPFGSLTKK